jgi:hypothetical protein
MNSINVSADMSAKEYAAAFDSITGNVNTNTFTQPKPNHDDKSNGSDVYVVVTEEWYGGLNDEIKVFAEEKTANEYAAEIGEKYNLDVSVLKKSVL